MKIKKYQATEEKTILTALIVHDGVLSQVMQAGKNPFKNRWSNQISKWCFEHYSKYQKAPNKAIQSYFLKYAQSVSDDTSVELMESFLAGLSDSYSALAKEINEKYVVDLASRYFEKVRLERMKDEIEVALEKDDLVEAREIYLKARPQELTNRNWTDLFEPKTVQNNLRQNEEDQTLIHFPGDLGRFLSQHFERGAFIAFAGSEKKGKSFWLQEVVWRAVKQKRRVLYYVLGDMTERQVASRLYQRVLLRPKHDKSIEWPVTLKIKKGEEGKPQPDVGTDTRNLEGLTVGAVLKAVRIVSKKTASKENKLKFMCQGAGVISASDIERDVQNFAREGWVPDAVIIDYSDLLADEPTKSSQDFRHRINETWKVLRRISIDYNLLVVTATQSAARAYDATIIRKKDFSEDKRKNAHVTGMIGINQTSSEKKLGVYRLNWILLRDGEWAEHQVVWTAGNLAVACPCLKSSL